jgi:hypothetical protein
VTAPVGDFFDLFSNYFARKPKVPDTAAVKESEAAKRERKIFKNILKITLKFLAMLPLKVHQARKGTEKKFRFTLKFPFWLT